jgi:hypothetical protein
MNAPRAAAFAALLLSASSLFAQFNIEINQGIGIQKNNAAKFVAGKDTVIRAFLPARVAIDAAQTNATIIRDGQTVATIPPAATADATSVVDFLCPDRNTCGGWAAGTYRFDVVVNGAAKSVAEVKFVERGPMRILAVPVRANYGGAVVPVTDDRWKAFSAYLKKVFPVDADRLTWSNREELDLSAGEFDLETDQGRFNVWNKLASLIPAKCATSPSDADCFQQVFGFIMARPKGYPNGTLQGYTYGKPANIGVITDEDAEATVAHEIGHTYGLGDTYNGGSINCVINPAPDEFRGSDFNNPETQVQCSAGKQALPGVSATKVPEAAAHPYDIGGRGALPDMGEFMGSGGAQAQFWTSQEAYDRMFDQLPPVPASALSVHAFAVSRFIAVSGLIRENASGPADVSLDPWWDYDDDGALPNTTGKYMVAAVDAAGRQLATRAIHPEFYPPPPKGQPAVKVNPAPFEEEMAFPPGTAKFQIRRDGVVVRELAVTANAPVFTSVAPELHGTVSGSTVVTWQATDADHDPLRYMIEYNPDVAANGDDWYVLDRDVAASQLRIDFAQLPGGTHAKVRLTATDGINSTEAESAEFAVPFKAPEVFITEAPTAVIIGNALTLEGDAEDIQDDLTESQLEWSSQISGVIGHGSHISVRDLPLGSHVITLKVTNSHGLTGTKSINVVVLKSLKHRSARH